MTTEFRIAVLDDYTGAAQAAEDWTSLAPAHVAFFQDHLTDPRALIERVSSFDAVVIERERTPFPREILAALPRLQLLCATGPVNWSIDYDAAREHGVKVCGTEARQDLAPELTIGLMLAWRGGLLPRTGRCATVAGSREWARRFAARRWASSDSARSDAS